MELESKKIIAPHDTNLILGQSHFIKSMEVCNIFCATANPVEVIIARTEQGCGILGVIDGEKPKGIESAGDKEERVSFLRTIGYKR